MIVPLTCGRPRRSQPTRTRSLKDMTSIENPSNHRFVLNNGDGEIPALGFGTLVSDRAETRNATKSAVEHGFRHLDCAERYRNEEEVGLALKELFADGTVRRDD